VSKLNRRIAALGVTGLLTLGLSSCGGISSDAVVQVNGHTITKSAFHHWMTVAAAASATGATRKPLPEPPAYTACIAAERAAEPKPKKGGTRQDSETLKKVCESQYKSAMERVLNFLIEVEWVLGQASEDGIKISDSEIHTRFTETAKSQFPKAGELQQYLQRSGESVSDKLLEVKLEALFAKIEEKTRQDAREKITEATVAKYYREHLSQYGSPERRNLLIILTKTEAQAKAAKRQVKSGQSFQSVAKRVSIDPSSKSAGGVLNGVAKGEQELALDEAVFAAKPGVLSGPVKTPFGYYIFKVAKVTRGSQQTLQQARSKIKQQLVSEAEKGAISTLLKEMKTRWIARTHCQGAYMIAVCDGYKSQLETEREKARASTTTAPSATTTTASTTATKPAAASKGAKKKKKK
jgi:foldase protein PrsA